MANSSLETLAWDFPISQTEEMRKQLAPYILLHKEIRSLLTVNDQQNRLVLHPRVRSQDDLPPEIVTRCKSLGGQILLYTIENLPPTVIEQIWTIVFFSGSKSSQPLAPNLPNNWRQVLSNFYPTTLKIEGKNYATVDA